MVETEDEIEFALSETKRMRLRYPDVQVAPFLHRMEDNMLYIIRENGLAQLAVMYRTPICQDTEKDAPAIAIH